MLLPGQLITLVAMKAFKKILNLVTLAVIIGTSFGQEEQCSGQIGEECTRSKRCCVGFCYNGKCIEEPCNLMDCTDGLNCINYDNCTSCPCRREGGCFAPEIKCSSNNCTCHKWDDCSSGCCSQGICVENPGYTICNPCCLAKCKNSVCALNPIICVRAPCNALPICVVDPPTNCNTTQCFEGKEFKFEAECDPITRNNCGQCVIPAPF